MGLRERLLEKSKSRLGMGEEEVYLDELQEKVLVVSKPVALLIKQNNMPSVRGLIKQGDQEVEANILDQEHYVPALLHHCVLDPDTREPVFRTTEEARVWLEGIQQRTLERITLKVQELSMLGEEGRNEAKKPSAPSPESAASSSVQTGKDEGPGSS